MTKNIRWFADISLNDLAEVGGKNASLGEMVAHLTQAHVKVPNGFATTAHAFTEFLAQNNLSQKIYARLKETNVDDVNQLRSVGAEIRRWVEETPFTPEFERDVREAYAELKRSLGEGMTVAVRSSATAEDLPNASFAGQQETVLNVGSIEDVFTSLKIVFASLFNDRAIAYREHQGFAHDHVALSAGIQQMVRSDLACSGVMFSVIPSQALIKSSLSPPAMAWEKPSFKAPSIQMNFMYSSPLWLKTKIPFCAGPWAAN